MIDNFVAKYPVAYKFIGEIGLLDDMAKLKTKSGKIELFLPDVEAQFAGYGALNDKDMDTFDGHDLCLTCGKTPIHTNGHTQAVPSLHDLMSDSPIWINPKTAKRKNLRDGDMVVVKNKFGEQKGKLMVTEGIREDTLFIYHGFGHITPALKSIDHVGLNTSVLLNPAEGPVAATMVTNVGVSISKA